MTTGNIFGGAFLVATVYRFIYCRPMCVQQKSQAIRRQTGAKPPTHHRQPTQLKLSNRGSPTASR